MRAEASLLGLTLLATAGPAAADEAAPASAAAPAAAPPASPPLVLPPPASEAEVEALRAALARQQARIDALQAEHDAAADRGQGGLAVRAGRFDLRLSGFVQVEWTVHDQSSTNEIDASTGAPLNQDRFSLRRGHLRLDASCGFFAGALEIDANTTAGPQVRPVDAEVAFRWPKEPSESLPSFEASAGLMRIPFGFEVQELDWVRPFLERAMVLRALFPGEFDLGARLRTRYRFLDLALAVMNGSPIGSREFPDLDPVHQKDLVGRLGVDLTIAPGLRLRAGVSGESGTGFHPGTPTTKDVVVWQDANGDGMVQPNEITVIPGSAAAPSQVFRRFAVGADAQVEVDVPWLGVLALRGEWVSASNLDRGIEVADPVATGRDLRETGWYVGATQEVTRWAALGVRYDRYDPDADASQQRGVALVPVDRRYNTLAFMAMARAGSQRLLVEYDLNANPLGISASGAPTTLADNALIVRAQLAF